MKLKEIAKTIENMNKLSKMLGNNKQCLSLWFDDCYNVKVYEVKDLKQLKDIYIKEAIEAVLNYDFTEEKTTIKRTVREYSWLEEKFVTEEREINVYISVYEERY